MPDFISNMKLTSLVNVESEEVVSLVELLLVDQAECYNKEKERAESTSTPGVKVRSRGDRRRSGRSAKTKNKEKSKTGSSVQKMEQLRQNKKRQDKRKAALLKYQTQKGQKKSSNTSASAGDGRASKRADKKRAEKESNSIEINPALRPVLLALVDFKPIFDSEGNITPVGNTVKIKRAARAMKVENLLEIDTSEELIGELDWLSAHISNLSQTQTFLDSLDASNIEMYEDALSAYDLDSTSTTSASNTEVLYTLIRDYCYSLNSCTPRLLESSSREFEAGTKLPKSIINVSPKPNYVRYMMRKSTSAVSNFYSYMSEDMEVSLKHLIATVSKELLLSFNKEANSVEDATLSWYPRKAGTAWIGYTFCEYFNVKPNVSRLSVNKRDVRIDNPFGSQNVHGLLYDVKSKNGNVITYPFEKCELVAATNYKSSDSAPDQIAKLYSAKEPSADLGPYADISTAWEETKESVDLLLETETLEFGTCPGNEVLETICRNIVSFCLEKLPTSSSDSAAVTDAIQIAWLSAAGRSETAWQWLILYLAFLQDQLTAAALTGEQTDTSALAFMVKRDTGLRELIGEPASSSTKKQYFSVKETSISIDPEPEDFTSPETLDAMEVMQETDIEDGEDSSTDSSLQSYFDLSWEEVCDQCTMGIRQTLNTETVAASDDDVSDETSVKLADVKDALQALATSEDSLFSELLSLMDDVDTLFANACFDDSSISNYTKISRQKLHSALILAAAKAVNFYIEDCTITSGALSSFYDEEQSFASASGTSIVSSGFSVTSKLRGPAMAASWTSTSSTATAISPITVGSSLKFSYAGISDRTEALTAFLDSEEIDVTLIEEMSSSLARVFTALDEDFEFQTEFIGSLDTYFSSVRDNYSAVVESISADIDEETEGTQTLVSRINNGLPMSTDMCKMLLNYVRTYDSSDATYGAIRTRDKALICSNMAFMASIFEGADYCEAGKLKYAAVGIPSGLMDMTREEPVDMADVDRDATENSRSAFTVSIEKVDLTRPELEYVDKEYSFSRNLFVNQIDDSTEGEIIVNFDNINSDFTVAEEAESGLSSETFSDEQIENLKNDFALKLYSDLFLDLDFFPDAYPQGGDQKKAILTGSISMPSLSSVDKTLEAFLSGSNLAFDTDARQLSGFTFYSEGTESLDMKKFKGLDPVAFSVFSYLNSYGTVASAASKKDSLKFGTAFERIVMIPFDPTDFEVELQSDDDDSAEQNIKNEKLAAAEEEVGIGLETSQGVELANYRVYVTIPDSGAEESE